MAELRDNEFLIGFEDLGKKLDALREAFGDRKVDRLAKKALEAAMAPVLNTAIANAPKDTGELSEHIYLRVKKPTSVDKASKYYQGEAVFARVTSSAVRSTSVKVYGLRKSKSGYKERFSHYRNTRPVPVSQEYGNKRTPKHSYIREALRSNSTTVIESFESELKQLIENLEFLKV